MDADPVPTAPPADTSYQIRTLHEASELAHLLAAAHPDPDRVVVGLTELLVNAVEHGNLGITYREKADLLERGGAKGQTRSAPPTRPGAWPPPSPPGPPIPIAWWWAPPSSSSTPSSTATPASPPARRPPSSGAATSRPRSSAAWRSPSSRPA